MEIEKQIYSSLIQGDELARVNNIQGAIKSYTNGIALLDRIEEKSMLPLHLFTARGDCYFYLSEFYLSEVDYKSANRHTYGKDSPYIWFLLGKTYCHSNKKFDCIEAFVYSYFYGGTTIFEKNEGGAMYLKFIEPVIKLADENNLEVIDVYKNDNLFNIQLCDWDKIVEQKTKQLSNKGVIKEERKNRPPGTTWSLLDDED